MPHANYLDKWNQALSDNRAFLKAFAYRLTGNLAEAEDLVQDVAVECAKVDPAGIENPRAWLTKVCSNKGLDHLKSASRRRETYHGTWLPDAVPAAHQLWRELEGSSTGEANLLRSESLTSTFLLLVERLTPEERVTYILAEVFEYSFKDIAAFLDKSEGACRKTAQRARDAIAASRPRFDAVKPDVAVQLITRFFEAAKLGDTEAMNEILADTSEFWADGGGKAPAATKVLATKREIANFFIAIGKVQRASDFRLETQTVNARPGVAIYRKNGDGWVLDSLMSFEFADGTGVTAGSSVIARIYVQRNPDRLRPVAS